MKLLDRSGPGSTASTREVNSKVGTSRPNRPPTTVTTNIQPISRTTRWVGTARSVELITHSSTIVIDRYQRNR
jgi:hypothetical protein